MIKSPYLTIGSSLSTFPVPRLWDYTAYDVVFNYQKNVLEFSKVGQVYSYFEVVATRAKWSSIDYYCNTMHTCMDVQYIFASLSIHTSRWFVHVGLGLTIELILDNGQNCSLVYVSLSWPRAYVFEVWNNLLFHDKYCHAEGLNLVLHDALFIRVDNSSFAV